MRYLSIYLWSLIFAHVAFGSTPLVRDLNTLPLDEIRLQQKKVELEKAGADLPKSIAPYFEDLLSLIRFRIERGLTHSFGWLRNFTLHIPTSDLNSISPGIIQIAESTGGKVGLLPNQTLIQALELENLAKKGDEPSVLKICQFLIIQQLFQNWIELRSLTDHDLNSPPELSESFTSVFETFKFSEVLVKEGIEASKVLALKSALVLEIPQQLRDLPSFSAIAMNHGQNEPNLKPYQDWLKEGEKSFFEENLKNEILSSAERLDQISKLKDIISESKRQTQIEILLKKMAEHKLNLESSERAQIVDFLQNKMTQYSTIISDHLVKEWMDHAQESIVAATAAHKTRLIETLIKKSNEIKNPKFIPALLLKSFDKEIASSDFSKPLLTKLLSLASEHDFISAQKKYSEISKSLMDESVLSNGLVDPSKVDEFLSDIPGAENVKKIIREYKKLVSLGEKMGFHRAYLTEPGVRDVLGGEMVGRYAEVYKNDVLTYSPILSYEMTSEGLKLYEILSHFSNVKGVETYVDEALSQMDLRIKSDLELISGVKSLEDIKPFIRSGIFQARFLSRFPELEKVGKNIFDTFGNSKESLTDRLFSYVINPYLHWGFSALIVYGVLQIALPQTTSVLSLVIAALKPYATAFLYSSVLPISLNLGHEYFQMADAEKNAETIDQWILSDGLPSSHHILEFQDWIIAQAKESASKRGFYLDLGLNSLFIGYPTVKLIKSHR